MREVFEVGQLVRSVWDGDYGIVYKREHKLGGGPLHSKILRRKRKKV